MNGEASKHKELCSFEHCTERREALSTLETLLHPIDDTETRSHTTLGREPLWKKHSLRQIYFSVSNSKFKKNIYEIFLITWQLPYFSKKYALIGNQRKLRKWREQIHPFCCYSSIDNIDCCSIQATRKKCANNIERTLDFYYSSQFHMATSLASTAWCACNEFKGTILEVIRFL